MYDIQNAKESHPMIDYRSLNRFPGTRKEHDRVVRTICQECPVGCGLLAYVKEGRIVDVQGDEGHPISRGRLCAKGMAFVQGLENPDRITRPAIRGGLDDQFEVLDDWEKGLDLLAEDLRKINSKYGPRSLLIACDPEAGLDYYIGAMRFSTLWGTPFVFHPMRSPGDLSIPPGLEIPARPCSDWVNSQCLFLVEADLATTHPVAFRWVLDAQSRGTKIIAADTRFTATMSKADMAVRIRPETGNVLGLVLMKMMLEEDFHDSAFLEEAFADPGQWKASFETMSLNGFEKATNLTLEKVKALSGLLANKSPVTLITGKRLANRLNYSIWLTMAMAMGWINVSGGGWYPLDSGVPRITQNPDIQDRDSFVDSFEEEGDPNGLLKELAETAQDLDSPVKAIICSGNCLNDFLSPICDIVKGMDLVVYFGSFPNATRDFSHMVFPATLWAERNGLCFSNDRAIQWSEKIVEPVDGCRSGLDFWMGLARRFGDVKRLQWEAYFPWKKEDGLADHRSFYNWILARNPDTEGYNVDRLRGSGDGSILVFWPFQEGNAHRGKIEPTHAPTAIEPDIQEPDEKELYPLYFQTTRIISHSRDASHWWPWTIELECENAVQIHPETAQALGIENGDDILVSGAVGMMEGRAWISRMVPRWMVWSPRKLGERRVVVYKKGQTSQEAIEILKELLQ
jgi:anaerobic selenocysteine-containing dehydrogenase